MPERPTRVGDRDGARELDAGVDAEGSGEARRAWNRRVIPVARPRRFQRTRRMKVPTARDDGAIDSGRRRRRAWVPPNGPGVAIARLPAGAAARAISRSSARPRDGCDGCDALHVV